MTVSVPQDPYHVVPVIYDTALQHHVSPDLAVATALTESGLNPRAVGDNGTSFGLYQLHRGGELGSLSPSQAYDPATNANVALGVFEQTQSKYHFSDPGALAAASQRPADRVGYARKVDANIQEADAILRAYGLPTPQGSLLDPALVPPSTYTNPAGVAQQQGGAQNASLTSSVGGAFNWLTHGVTSIISPVTAPLDFFKTVFVLLTDPRFWIRVLLVVGGFVVIVIGIKKAV